MLVRSSLDGSMVHDAAMNRSDARYADSGVIDCITRWSMISMVPWFQICRTDMWGRPVLEPKSETVAGSIALWVHG